MTDYLWTKGQNEQKPDTALQQFACADDLELDRRLLPYDIRASQAHVRGLRRIGVLEETECQHICDSLNELLNAVESGVFRLQPPLEDGHSAIEFWLSERLGETGRKVHAGRSRNDQVQVAMRLYLRECLANLGSVCREIARVCLQRAAETVLTPMPGYTHVQRAVPSTLELWFAGFAEAFIDIAALAQTTSDWINVSPLGTAAGFGVNLPLDREGVARELGFDRVQLNPQYVQNSRGRFELQGLVCAAQATLELRRLAWDLSLFGSPEFGFVRLPDRYTTGSSIMPNKRNPDLVELLRAQHAVVQGAMSEIQSTIALPSGYHRDLQMTKSATMRGVESSLAALQLVPDLLRQLEFDTNRMRQSISPEMYSTDIAIERVRGGMAFRDAYRQPVTQAELVGRTAESSVAARVSLGGCANLGLAQMQSRLDELDQKRHGGGESSPPVP